MWPVTVKLTNDCDSKITVVNKYCLENSPRKKGARADWLKSCFWKSMERQN